ncbi:MAG TPA: cytochrome C oxidase subunit IV family protein [Candidatus Acidoferrum sp.]|nr:cytochrome C oxidase subunit IV family protein [Candidatus Acidoferrum sp.]
MSEKSEHHVVSPLLYFGILCALLAGTVLTVWAATIDLKQWNIVLALLIATTKMSLVILFFMHGKYSPRRTQLVIISGFFWLAIMLGLTLMDYTTRHPEPSRSANPPAIVLHRA